ncbi:histone H2B type 1-L-like [Cetorhinus maximus]
MGLSIPPSLLLLQAGVSWSKLSGMPEVAAVTKGVSSHKASKQLLTKVTKKLPKKRKKFHKQSYPTYMYRVLTQVHRLTRISSKAMGVMNSFIVDIFECIASEASHLIHYNKHHLGQRDPKRRLPHAAGELAKHVVSEDMKVVTKYTNSV